MMQKIKNLDSTCVVQIKDGKLLKNNCMFKTQKCLMSRVAPQLPDL